jgi:hypothetical protein
MLDSVSFQVGVAIMDNVNKPKPFAPGGKAKALREVRKDDWEIKTGGVAMPSSSEKQRRAMQAAAHGQSNIGIPQKVGQEFAAADSAKRKQGPFHLPMRKKVKKP